MTLEERLISIKRQVDKVKEEKQIMRGSLQSAYQQMESETTIKSKEEALKRINTLEPEIASKKEEIDIELKKQEQIVNGGNDGF